MLDHQHKLFVYVDIRKGISCLLSLVIVFFLLSINNAAGQQQQQGLQQSQSQTTQGLPIVFIPAVTGNILAVVSFLIGTSSFILGLRIQVQQELLLQDLLLPHQHYRHLQCTSILSY